MIKLARLYLISDLLFNSSVPSSACFWSFRMYFEHKLPEIFEGISDCLSKRNQIEGDMKFIDKVMTLMMVWNDWVIFDSKFLMGLEALLNKKPKKNSDNLNVNSIIDYDTSTQLGIKLKCLEEDLKSQTINDLEKACKTNGLPITGIKNKLIERILILEEYKLKWEKNNDYNNDDSLKKHQASKKNEKTITDAKSSFKNSLSLIKSFRSIDNRNLTESSFTEIDNFCKIYLAVFKLLQSRAEKFNIAEIDGMEFDEIDECIYDIKKKLTSFEDNIDGIYYKYIYFIY